MLKSLEVVDIKDSPFRKFKKEDWCLYFIERYGQIQGAHHKQWVLDCVARILNDCEIEIEKATFDDYQPEFRVSVIGETTKYLGWVEETKCGGIYSYDEGIAP
jgi:hypothetical protein